mmetsp:Transcript_70126/g.205582  ORF Transcript_70126/g.205582 Transcript_70126/m.205582 type:complete len:202 (+) Transcript_70126:722-1327(+)
MPMNIWRTDSYEYGNAKPAKSPAVASGDCGERVSSGMATICSMERGTCASDASGHSGYSTVERCCGKFSSGPFSPMVKKSASVNSPVATCRSSVSVRATPMSHVLSRIAPRVAFSCPPACTRFMVPATSTPLLSISYHWMCQPPNAFGFTRHVVMLPCFFRSASSITSVMWSARRTMTPPNRSSCWSLPKFRFTERNSWTP